MPTVYEVWISRKDGVLEMHTDEEGMPFETEDLRKAKETAQRLAREDHVKEIHIREKKFIEVIPGKSV